MPKFAPITLTDNSVTPAVPHVFDPTANGKQAMFTDRAKDSVLSWPKLSVEVKAATAASGKTASRVVLSVPVVPATPDGCCDIGEVTFNVFDVRSSLSSVSSKSDRSTTLALIRAYVASDDFEQVVAGESYYA